MKPFHHFCLPLHLPLSTLYLLLTQPLAYPPLFLAYPLLCFLFTLHFLPTLYFLSISALTTYLTIFLSIRNRDPPNMLIDKRTDHNHPRFHHVFLPTLYLTPARALWRLLLPLCLRASISFCLPSTTQKKFCRHFRRPPCLPSTSVPSFEGRGP